MNLRTGETSFSTIPVDESVSYAIESRLRETMLRIHSPDFHQGPWASLVQFGQICYLLDDLKFNISGKKFIDFGCGHERPFTISTLLYLCGASKCLGVDFAGYQNPKHVAFGLYATLISILSNELPGMVSSLGASQMEIRENITKFNVPSLFDGQISCLPKGIDNIVCDYKDLSIDERSFDLLFSGSVLEHVADLKLQLDLFREGIQPEGYLLAVIDLRDHRLYAGTAPHAWQFMLDGSDASPGFINKLRCSKILEMCDEAGFDAVKVHKVAENVPADLRDRALPEFRDLSEEDLATTELWLCLKGR